MTAIYEDVMIQTDLVRLREMLTCIEAEMKRTDLSSYERETLHSAYIHLMTGRNELNLLSLYRETGKADDQDLQS